VGRVTCEFSDSPTLRLSESNECRYMQGFKCNVTGATSTAPLAKAQAPVYCADDASKCVTGAKQMIAWKQLTGDNVVTPDGASPGYSEKCGWTDGPQRDIFE